MIEKIRFKISILILLSLLLTACSSGPTSIEIRLSAQDIKWDLTEIEAQVGQEISLTITNEGILDHNFILLDFDINIEIPPGESQVVTFVANEPGSFEYHCDIPGHLDAGMVGALTINP